MSLVFKKESCHEKGIRFYPFVDYFEEEAPAMSYTVDREHIRLARFSMGKYA